MLRGSRPQLPNTLTEHINTAICDYQIFEENWVRRVCVCVSELRVAPLPLFGRKAITLLQNIRQINA